MATATTAIGNQAEDAAADYLIREGFQIVARNWRTRFCEIDIIARKCRGKIKRQCRAHIVEVKFRKGDSYGRPEEYVGPRKLRQLKRAAEYWAHSSNWTSDIQIDVIAIDGADGNITYLPNITF